MPTFIAFKDGQKVDELVGANPGRLEVRLTTIIDVMPALTLIIDKTLVTTHLGA